MTKSTQHLLREHRAYNNLPLHSPFKFTITQQFSNFFYKFTYAHTNIHQDDCTVNDKLLTPEKTHKYHKTNKYTNKILQVNHGQTTVQLVETMLRLHYLNNYQFLARLSNAQQHNEGDQS